MNIYMRRYISMNKLSVIGLDVETAKAPNHFPWKEDFYIACVSISYPDDTARTWFFHHDQIVESDSFKNIVEIQNEINQYDIVAAHNAKFDMNVTRGWLNWKKCWCTQVSEYLLNNHSNKNLKLNDLCTKYGESAKLDKVKTMWEAGMDTCEIPVSILQEYCEDDAAKARKIALKQMPLIKKKGLHKVMQLQMEWLDMLSFMETKGVNWDQKAAQKIVDKHSKYSRILESKIRKLIKPYTGGHELSLTSNDELSALLYGGDIKRREKVPIIKEKNVKVQMPYVFQYANGNKKIKSKWKSHPATRVIRMVFRDRYYSIPGMGFKPLKKTEAAKSTDDRKYYKTDKNTLPYLEQSTFIQKAIIALLLKKSSVDKVVSTLFNSTNNTGLMSKIGTDGLLHTNYNQTVTATGRLSSSDPNSQNMSRSDTSPIKQCFVPRYDGIMDADKSQLEWRVACELAQEMVGIDEIKKGKDAHGDNCTKIMKLVLNKTNRVYAKILLFRIIYGGTEFGFHMDSKMPRFGLKGWRTVVENFYNKYKKLHNWHKQIVSSVIQGNGTYTLFTGRIYKFFLEYQGKYNERKIKNHPVQGLAGADILPLAGVIVWTEMKKRKLKSIPILTVHDSLIFDYINSEKDELADLCMKVFNNMPKYIKAYWGYDWKTPITGEVECGPNWGKQKRIR